MTYHTYSDTEPTPVGTDIFNGATLTRSNTIVRRYPSIYDATLKALEKPERPDNAKRWDEYANQGNKHSSNLSWYGVKEGLPEVKRILQTGWEHGRVNLQGLSQSIIALNGTPRPTSIKRKRVRSDQGDSLDITRVWSGELDRAWERCNRLASNSRKYVEIVATPSINSGTNAEVIFWRGAACLILADIMQTAGYNVAITAAIATNELISDGETKLKHALKHAMEIIPLKDYSDPLDMDNLASVICLGGWFRHIGFCLMINHPFHVPSGLGHGSRLSDFIELAPHQISELESINSMETASKWILNSVKKLQGETEEV